MIRKIHCMHFDKEKGQDTIVYHEKLYSTTFGMVDCKCTKCGEAFNVLDVDKVNYIKNRVILSARDIRDIVNTMKFLAAPIGKEVPYKYTELLNILEYLPEDASEIFEDFCQYENKMKYEHSNQSLEDMKNDNK